MRLAIIANHIEIDLIRVNAGADWSIRGKGALGFYNQTALMLAGTRGQREVVQRLKAAEAAE